MDIYEEISRNVVDGNAIQVKNSVEKALALLYSPESILKNGLILGVEMLAHKYRVNAVSVPEAMLTTRAFNMGLKLIKPHLKTSNQGPIYRVVIGTVEGDLHDIGKNLVKTYLATLNLEIIDLGVDVSKESFANAVREYKPHILMLSTLLLTSLDEIKNIIQELKHQGLRDGLVIFAGGQPVTPEFAKEAGADYYSSDAIELRNFLEKNLSKIIKVK